MLSRCCEGCPFLVREVCEKAQEKNKDKVFVYCNTQNVRLLKMVAE